MQRRIGIAAGLIVSLCFASTVRAAGELDALAARAAASAREQFKDEAIKDNDLAISVIDLRDSAKPRVGSYRGDQPMFPASIVKLFYLAHGQRLLEDGKLTDSEELQRGLRDMIVDSSNDATSFILDTITDAPNGSVLPPAEMEQWSAKRNAVNRFFASLGYEKINVNQKAYCEGPYGRERIFIGPKLDNRNKLTTDATAKLMAEIAQRRFVSAARSDAMMKLLSRARKQKSKGPDDQAHGFVAGVLPPGAKVWSKAGWTSTARHDAAYIEGGRRVARRDRGLHHRTRPGTPDPQHRTDRHRRLANQSVDRASTTICEINDYGALKSLTNVEPIPYNYQTLAVKNFAHRCR